MPKIITIGSATMDVFVECDEANIVSVCTKDRNSEFMSYPYGAKIDISLLPIFDFLANKFLNCKKEILSIVFS